MIYTPIHNFLLLVFKMFLKTSILFFILVIFCSGLDLGVTEK